MWWIRDRTLGLYDRFVDRVQHPQAFARRTSLHKPSRGEQVSTRPSARGNSVHKPARARLQLSLRAPLGPRWIINLCGPFVHAADFSSLGDFIPRQIDPATWTNYIQYPGTPVTTRETQRCRPRSHRGRRALRPGAIHTPDATHTYARTHAHTHSCTHMHMYAQIGHALNLMRSACTSLLNTHTHTRTHAHTRKHTHTHATYTALIVSTPITRLAAFTVHPAPRSPTRATPSLSRALPAPGRQ